MLHSREPNRNQDKPRLLFLDTAYTMRMVRERGLEQEFASRECGGYFEHVWAVHPIADIPERRPLNYEGFRISTIKFSENQTVLEGLSAYYRIFKRSFPVNFVISQVRFVSYLNSLVRRQRISIVLSTDPYFSGLIGLFVKLFTGIPLVIWVCGNYDDLFQATGKPTMPRLFRWKWLEKIVERIVLSSADLVAGGNQDNLEFALKNGATANKSTVFPVGKLIHRQHLIEPKLRTTDELFSLGDNGTGKKYWFIYIGRLVDVKHPDDVLRAFSIIEQTVHNSALIVAGDGAMRPTLESMANELGIRSKVNFLGNIGQERLAQLLAGCFAILSPLTGRSLVEGALAAVPIIAYDRDWQTDFVLNAGAGVIVPFRDWKGMGTAALDLVREPVRARAMGQAARKEALRRCDLDQIYGHEQNEFDKLLQRSRFAAPPSSEALQSG